MKLLSLLFLTVGCLEPSQPSREQIESCERHCEERNAELDVVLYKSGTVVCLCDRGCETEKTGSREFGFPMLLTSTK